MAVTIKDIAREAHLSVSTISKYLNGGQVREKNRHTIEQIIEKYNYHPNHEARALRAQKTYRIGLLTDSLQNQFFSRLEFLMEKKLREKNFILYVCIYNHQIENAQTDIRRLIQKQVDGIFIVTSKGVEHCIETAKASGVPVVLLDRGIRDYPVDYVMSNTAPAIYQATEYLIRKGHTRIGMITAEKCRELSPRYHSMANDGSLGFCRAMEDYDLPVRKEYMAHGDFSFESGYECMMQLWDMEERPTAVLIGNYNMFMGAITAIHNRSISIPEDLSVITYDNLEFTQMVDPPITAIEQNMEEIADEAVALLLRRIDGDFSDFPKKVRVNTRFYERASVAEHFNDNTEKAEVEYGS